MPILLFLLGCTRPPAALDVRLDGAWHSDTRTVQLPTARGVPDTPFSRTITVPVEWSGGAAELELAATGWRVHVSLDGVEVGQATGGLWPARVPITDRLKSGQHVLSFAVQGPAPDNILPGSTLQPVSGWVWGMPREGEQLARGAITLRLGPARRIERVEARLIDAGATVEASAWTVGVEAGSSVALTLVRDGATALTLTGVVGEDGMARATAPWTGPRWPDPGGLYTVTADAGEGARRQARIGLRASEPRADGLYVNGVRTYVAASRLSVSEIGDRYALGRSARVLASEGANAAELHGEVVPPWFFDAADELGLPIVLTPRCDGQRVQGGRAVEVPDSAEHQAFVDAGDRLARDALRSHPSILLWTIEAPLQDGHPHDPEYAVDGLPVLDEHENSNFPEPTLPPRGIPRGKTAFYGELPWVTTDAPGFSFAERLARVFAANVATGDGLVLPAINRSANVAQDRAQIHDAIVAAGIPQLRVDPERRGISTLLVRVSAAGKPVEGAALVLELPGQFPVGAFSDAVGIGTFEVDYAGDATVRVVGGAPTPVHLTPGVWRPGEWAPNASTIGLTLP